MGHMQTLVGILPRRRALFQRPFRNSMRCSLNSVARSCRRQWPAPVRVRLARAHISCGLRWPSLAPFSAVNVPRRRWLSLGHGRPAFLRVGRRCQTSSPRITSRPTITFPALALFAGPLPFPGACRSAAASPARTLAVKRSPWRRIAGWGDHRVIYGWVTNANGGRFLRPAPAVRVSLASCAPGRARAAEPSSS